METPFVGVLFLCWSLCFFPSLSISWVHIPVLSCIYIHIVVFLPLLACLRCRTDMFELILQRGEKSKSKSLADTPYCRSSDQMSTMTSQPAAPRGPQHRSKQVCDGSLFHPIFVLARPRLSHSTRFTVNPEPSSPSLSRQTYCPLSSRLCHLLDS